MNNLSTSSRSNRTALLLGGLLPFAVFACCATQTPKATKDQAKLTPSATTAAAAATPVATAVASTSTPAAAACGGMTRTLCMRAAHCTLELVSKRPDDYDYLCRPANSACEQNIAQANLEGTDLGLSDGTVDRCNSRPGCQYQRSECYCPCKGYGQTSLPDGAAAEMCECECAGGRPPSCVAAPSP